MGQHKDKSAEAVERRNKWKPTPKGYKTNGGVLPGIDKVWNPLRRFPRNAPCFCGSKEKFKRCCAEKLADTIHRDHFKKHRATVCAAGR